MTRMHQDWQTWSDKDTTNTTRSYQEWRTYQRKESRMTRRSTTGRKVITLMHNGKKSMMSAGRLKSTSAKRTSTPKLLLTGSQTTSVLT